MPLILSVVLSLILSSEPHFKTATVSESIDQVISAIDNGSSGDLAKYFDSSLALNINGQQGEYSKNQAELVIKDFFKKNPSMGFKVVYRSETNPSLGSFIGDYQSQDGSFKVFIKVAQPTGNLKIYGLEFVKG
jgi:hypothetical protein